MAKPKSETEAASAAARLEVDDWASILTRWAMMLDHMPPEVVAAAPVREAAGRVASRLPTAGR